MKETLEEYCHMWGVTMANNNGFIDTSLQLPSFYNSSHI
jgi:hypothetical protein